MSNVNEVLGVKDKYCSMKLAENWTTASFTQWIVVSDI